MAHCDDLSLGGLDDWRLPEIQELISLARGCVGGVATGDASASACGLADPGCLGSSCLDSSCAYCDALEGPDTDPAGCYWDAALEGPCDSYYWSSSSVADNPDVAWIAYFYFGGASYDGKTSVSYARCVRGGT